jgi:phage terminase Nu1 subunit (DNA packaging protein)
MARKKSASGAATALAEPARATVSNEGLAEFHGVHVKTVALWIKSGMPVESRKGRANTINLAAATLWLRERDAETHRKELEAARSAPDMDALKARKLDAESRISEAEADLVEGKQVLVAEVESAWARITLAIREAVLSLASRAVQSGAITPEQEDAVADLARDILLELSKGGEEEAA